MHSKKDFQRLLFQILDPLRNYYSDGKALLKLGNTGTKYDERCAQMEGFARSFWGLVPFFAGGGRDEEFLQNCITGLQNGTDPQHKEYWGGFKDIDQRFCEMAALAVGLLMIPEKLWQPLSETEKENVESWLLNINRYKLGPNNWQFFLILVNSALKKLGRTYDQKALDASFEQIESFYLGDGWYQDGRLRNKDYYIAFAFHFYGLIYAKIMVKDDPERSQLYQKRAARFALDYQYWFDDKGEGVPYGRSLTYRFAQVSFFSACLFAGIEPLPIAVMKGIITRNLELWFQAPLFDNGGVLSIGYKYPNLCMAENYNGPGSPLWSLKTFLFLALPDNHPFWSVEAVPMPKLEPKKLITKAEKIFVRDTDCVTMYPNGSPHVVKIQGHILEKYSKFAYSSKYGFSVQSSSDILEGIAPDSTTVFEVNGIFYLRQNCETVYIDNNKIITKWSPIKEVQVVTTIEPRQNGYTRFHEIESKIPCVVYDFGFALPLEENYKEVIGKNDAAIYFSDGFCMISGGEGLIIKAQPNTNLMHSRTAIPGVKSYIDTGNIALKIEITFN